MEKHRIFGRDVVQNGVFQSIEHFILTVQMEKQCSREGAIGDAVKLLEDLAIILKDELGGNDGKETRPSSPVPA